MAVQPARSWSAPSCCSRIVPRASSRARTPASSTAPPRRRRAPASRRWCSTSSAAAAIVQEDPNVDGFMSSVGAGGRSSTVNQGRLFIHLKPRDERPLERRRGRAVAHARSWPRCPGMRVFITQPAGDPHRRPLVQEPVPVHPAELRHRRAVRRRRRSWSSGCTTCPGSRTSPATCRSRTRRCRSSIDRDRAVGARRSTSSRSRTRSTTPTARGRSRTIYTPNNQYWVIMELLPAVPARPVGADPALRHAAATAVSVPLGSRGQGDAGRRARSR